MRPHIQLRDVINVLIPVVIVIDDKLLDPAAFGEDGLDNPHVVNGEDRVMWIQMVAFFQLGMFRSHFSSITDYSKIESVRFERC